MTSEADSVRAHLDQSLGAAYRIERELGGGGMSRVFLAEELALHRRVVVKVLAPNLAHELSAERFAREIQLTARLQHPNIVPVLSAGTAMDVPYYTMPFIDGETLRARINSLKAGERLAPAQAIDVLRDVARALAYAHDMGFVHRDIKPENVLLGMDAALVADFGVAKAMAAARAADAPPSGITLTQGGMALGTPAYMAPEQAAGEPTVNQRADLYAWGVLAYEVLAGAHPFAGSRSMQEMITAHFVTRPAPLNAETAGVSSEVCAIVMRCLEKNPNDRPGSAREIVDTFTSTSQTSQPVRVAPGIGDRPLTRRPRMALLTIVAFVLTLAAVGTMYGRWSLRTSARAQLASANPIASPAYDLYLLGKVRVGSENRADNDAAIAALNQAIKADPNFAPAYATLGRAYSIKAFYFAPDSEKKQLVEDAEVNVEKSLSLDPNLAEGHFARGLLLWTPGRRFPHEQAVQAYRQALALDPKLDEAHHQIALVLLHVGLLDQASAELRKALALNPSNTMARFRIGVVAMYRGDYQDAYDIFNSTPLAQNPTLWGFQMATAQVRLGRDREAQELLDRFLRENPKDEGGVGHSVQAMMLAKAGKRSDAEAAIAKSLELGRNFGHFHHTAYNIASAYALLGDRQQAIRWLQDAADNGFPCYPLFEKDAYFDALRGNPQFQAFMAKQKQDWERRKQQLAEPKP